MQSTMTALEHESAGTVERERVPTRPLHPFPLRAMHWVNAFAMIVMIGSGWHIYEDEPIFGAIRFPHFLLMGADPPGALQLHFAAMWLIAFNGLLYLGYGLVTGRFRRMLLPLSIREILRTAGDALTFKLPHHDVTTYNPVQKLLYIGVILLIIVQVLSGLAIWKPVQLQELTALFGGFQGSRLVHFLAMSGIVLFLAVHILLTVLVPSTLVAMLTGGPRVPKRRRDAEALKQHDDRYDHAPMRAEPPLTETAHVA